VNADTDSNSVLGLERGSVRLRPYTSRWAELFRAEDQAIRTVLGALVLDVQHVGSTAVPGMMSKPILDIAIGVPRLEDFERCIEPLTQLGYEHAHWAGLEDNEVFGKGIRRTHLVHVVKHGGQKWNNYILFRDSLRQNPATASAYQQLKVSLSLSHANNRAAYTDAKNAFICGILSAA
jgi:GrpB-like predicted nucleotidyltransferase (UPF0157 family)